MNVKMLSRDTDRESALRQMDVLREMGMAGRMAMTFELSDNLRSIVVAGIRHRHPEYSDEQVTQAWFSLVLDRELFRKAFPDSEVSAASTKKKAWNY